MPITHPADGHRDPTEFWDEIYAGGTTSERANPLLVETAEGRTPGAALDLGCGRGGDALWLARRGWRVTAVDISANAVARLRERAAELGLDRLTAQRHDLTHTFPQGPFDLVSAHYLHTPFAIRRDRVLRAAAEALRPGGLLLVVDHGSIAPWSWNQDPDTRFPTPTEIAAELDLDRDRWSITRADTPRRTASGPDGQTATVTDHVLAITRADR